MPTVKSNQILAGQIDNFKTLVAKGEIFKGKSCKELFYRGCNLGDFKDISRSLEGNEHPEAVNLLDAITRHLQPDEDEPQPREESPAIPSCQVQIIMTPVSELAPHPLVKDFYPIDPEMLASMSELMKERGYDPRFPIQVCMKDGKSFVWDGITRLKAATDADIKTVPVIVSEFLSDDDLMEAVVEVQLRRRNATPRVIIASVERLIDIAGRKAKENQGRRNDLLGTSGPIEPEVEYGGANEYIAKVIGRSVSTVKRIKEVIENPTLKQKVMEGKISPNQAYESLHPKKSDTGKCSSIMAEIQKFSGGENEDESSLELKTAEDSNADVQPPEENTPFGKDHRQPEASAVSSVVAERLVKESDEDTDTIRVPIKFLQVVVKYIYISHVPELIDLVGGPDSVGGRIINEALEKRKAA